MAIVKKHGRISAVYSLHEPVLMIMARATYHSEGIPVMARFDTGATVSCISNDIVEQLHAPVYSTGIIRSATGETQVNKYMLVLDFKENMRIGGILTYAADLAGLDDTDFIIGMDIISLGDLTVRKDGTFVFEI